MATIAEQKVIAYELLKLLEAVDPSCILAGGAPRNWFLGLSANDLDFFVYIPKGETNAQTKLRWTALGLSPNRLGLEDLDDDYESHTDLSSVWEGYKNGQRYQIMVMSQPTYTSVIPEFGTSVCMAWWKGTDIETTDIFLYSHAYDVIYEQPNLKEKHRDKMRAYFPDYEIRPIAQFQAHIADLNVEVQHRTAFLLAEIANKINKLDADNIELQEVI